MCSIYQRSLTIILLPTAHQQDQSPIQFGDGTSSWKSTSLSSSALILAMAPSYDAVPSRSRRSKSYTLMASRSSFTHTHNGVRTQWNGQEEKCYTTPCGIRHAPECLASLQTGADVCGLAGASTSTFITTDTSLLASDFAPGFPMQVQMGVQLWASLTEFADLAFKPDAV